MSLEIQGLGIPFMGPVDRHLDWHGKRFGPWTNFCLEWFPEGRPILLEHDDADKHKTIVVGRQVGVRPTDIGLWVTCRIADSEYSGMVKSGVENGLLSFSSSGGVTATVYEDKMVRYPWVELSLVKCPANCFAITWPQVKAIAPPPPSRDVDFGDVDPEVLRKGIVQGVKAGVEATLAEQLQFERRITALQKSLTLENRVKKERLRQVVRRDPGVDDRELASRLGLEMDKFRRAVDAGIVGIVSYGRYT